MSAQTTQEALNNALKDLQAWKAAALATQAERDQLAAQLVEVKNNSTGKSSCAKFCESVALAKDFQQLRGKNAKLNDEKRELLILISALAKERHELKLAYDDLMSGSKLIIAKENLTEIKAQAGRAGFLVAMQNYAFDTTSIEDNELADQYAESIRKGGE